MDINNLLICPCNGKLYAEKCCLLRHQETDLHKTNMIKVLKEQNEKLKYNNNDLIKIVESLVKRMDIMEKSLTEINFFCACKSLKKSDF